jgi:alkylhydroperoxidase/carboxymuconolactone decarboxylase family protein YurZ
MSERTGFGRITDRGKPGKGETMATRKKLQIDFEYEEVLDAKTRRLVHIGSAVAAGCPG